MPRKKLPAGLELLLRLGDNGPKKRSFAPYFPDNFSQLFGALLL